MNIIQFVNDQKLELMNDGFFKIHTHCFDCGTRFIFKNFDLKTKKVCVCQSNNWIIDNIVEC